MKEELRDINHVSMSEQDEEDAKRDLMFRFELLQKKYPSSNIPEYTIHSNYDSMKKSYDHSIRRLSLDDSVDKYKKYLMGGFALCEYIFGSLLGFKMEGFTQDQMGSMSSYEKLLIEMGEKSYTPTGSKWPVEIRLLGMIIFNAAIFIIGKMIMSKTGINPTGLMSHGAPQVPPSHQPKSRMRGPTIRVDDIPDE